MMEQAWASIEAFTRDTPFRASRYDVFVTNATPARLLVSWSMPRPDERGARQVPEVTIPSDLSETDSRRVFNALVRGGIQHPGLRTEDLCAIHREAEREFHVELFADISAITTGLLRHLVRSLGRSIGRIVVASTSIDLLHEYQRALKKSSGQFLPRAEMARALHVLEELRRFLPVHIHQLPPGASRYLRRSHAGPNEAEAADDEEQLTYIAEDRQMVAAYWDYVSSTIPRVPVRMVTSDHALARVCTAERVPLLFARAPFEVWRRMGNPRPEALWYDPFALALRTCTAHALLWELVAVYHNIQIIPSSSSADGSNSGSEHDTGSEPPFSLIHDTRERWPGEPMQVIHRPAVATSQPELDKHASTNTGDGISARIVRLKIPALLSVLPTKPEQVIPLARFGLHSEDSVRVLRQVGEATRLFRIIDTQVEAGPALQTLLDALKQRDYEQVNEIFRGHPTYSEWLDAVARGEPFPNSKRGGAITGWAITLGAAYKTQQQGVRYGLARVTDDRFAAAVARAHVAIGRGQQAVSLPLVMHDVCVELDMSPIRFEVFMERCLGTGALRDYETQRATVDEPIPAHPVLVTPTSEEPESYLRSFEPGKGLMIHGRLVASLVRRQEVEA